MTRPKWMIHINQKDQQTATKTQINTELNMSMLLPLIIPSYGQVWYITKYLLIIHDPNVSRVTVQCPEPTKTHHENNLELGRVSLTLTLKKPCSVRLIDSILWVPHRRVFRGFSEVTLERWIWHFLTKPVPCSLTDQTKRNSITATQYIIF